MSAAKQRVAVVTGSNKGIGLAVVRGLCKKFEGDVYLTARNEANGKSAIEMLKSEGLNPKFHQLDITDTESIERLKAFLVTNYEGLDVLVNNAGIAYKFCWKDVVGQDHVKVTVSKNRIFEIWDVCSLQRIDVFGQGQFKVTVTNIATAKDTTPFPEQTEVTFRTNFWCLLDSCDRLYPILKPHSRVVHVSSFTTDMVLKKCSKSVQDRVKNPSITMQQLTDLMKEFENSTKDGTTEAKGWATWAYAVSKVGVRVMSSVQQRELDKDSREDIIVNAADPGWVQTDMTGGGGNKTPDEGADTLIYCALLPPNTKSPRGEYVSDRKVHQWS